MHLRLAAAATACALLLGACGGDPSDSVHFTGEADGPDSPEKVMQDQVTYANAMATVIGGVADGGDPSKAAAKLRELGRAGDVLYSRRDKLFKELAPAQLQELMRKYQGEATAGTLAITQAMLKLKESGKATEELIDAVMNMKNN